nr:type II secretion system protein [Pseudanabaena sp. FACHB-2040]
MQRLTARLLKADPTLPSGLPDKGLTLIECLVAIVMVSLVIGTVAPALVISTATRIQSQKTEQALKVAQAEIDRVRTIVERGTYETVELPQSTPVTTENKTAVRGSQYVIEYPESVDGPQVGNLRDSTTAYTGLGPFDARRVDVNGDGNPDLAVQVYRSPGRLRPGSNLPVNFVMGVRVYDIQAFEGGNTGNLPVEQSRAAMTAGEGDRRRQPLAVLYTSVAKGDVTNSYCDYFTYLGSTPSANFRCD